MINVVLKLQWLWWSKKNDNNLPSVGFQLLEGGRRRMIEVAIDIAVDVANVEEELADLLIEIIKSEDLPN